jgi:regulator of protease activity HflC (stomatin/prohibitin superfamily)
MGTVVGLVVAALLVIWGLSSSVTKRGDVIHVQQGRVVSGVVLAKPGRLGGAILAAIAVYQLASWSVVILPGAHIACVYDPLRGGIQDHTLPEGLQIIPPWVTTQVFSVQTQEYTMSITPSEGAVIGDDSIKCETNEGLKVLLDVTVLFHIDPQRAPQLWRRLGEEYNDIFVRPVTRERIRMVVAKYGVQDVYSGLRKQVETEITNELKEPFEKEGLALEQVLLRNVSYGHQEFADAIAEKQARQQQVITEKRNLERAQYEKSATVNRARGEAQSVMLRAQTLSQNPEVVRYEMSQKLGPRVRKAYLSESAVPLPRGGATR